MVMGRPNSSYLICGTAVRLCQAAGLHKEGSNSYASAPVMHERRMTYWSLYTLERYQIRFCWKTYS